MRPYLDGPLKTDYPDIQLEEALVGGIKIDRKDPELEAFKQEVYEEVRGSITIEELKDDPLARLYRDFYWRIGIDPTKIRPSAEALIRRILQGKELSRINTAVDAYNLASVQSGISIATFDSPKLEGELVLRYAERGETFLGIGMKKSKILQGKEIVMADQKKLLAVYPYRDADDSKVTLQTQDILILSCGVPGIKLETLRKAVRLSADYISRFCRPGQ